MSIRISQNNGEFGQSFQVGQIVTTLAPLEELAMVVSGFASFLPQSANSPTTFPDAGIVPLTSVMLRNPAAYGLTAKSGRTFEVDGKRWFWTGRAMAPMTAKGILGGRWGQFGDSMNDWTKITVLPAGVTMTSAIYDAASGFVTFNFSGAPNFYRGMPARFWNYGFPSLYNQFYDRLERVSLTSWRLMLRPNLPGVPNGTDLAPGQFLSAEQGIAMNSFIAWIQMLYGQPLNIVRVGSQSGATAQMCRAALARDVLAWNLDGVIGQLPGINDLSFTWGPRSVADIIADNEYSLTTMLEAGITVMMSTVTPVGLGESRATRQNMVSVTMMNDAAMDVATRYSNFCLVDGYGTFVDPANADGLAFSSMVRGGDNIHPAAVASIRNARIKWRTPITRFVRTTDSTLPKSAIDCHRGSMLAGTVTPSAAGGVITISNTNHGLRQGDAIRSRGSSFPAAHVKAPVSVANFNTFSFPAPGVADGTNLVGLNVSRHRNLFLNPLLLLVSPPGTNNFSANIPGTVPTGFSLGGGGTMTGTCGVRAAVGIANSDLQPPVGNEFFADLASATAGSFLDFSSQGTTTFMQDLLPGMSFLIEHIFCWRSTNWANTPIRQFLSQLAITDGECNPVVYASAAQDPAESIVITQDTRIHVRTPVTRVDENGVLTSASFLMRTNLPVAWSPGQGVLTCAIETVAIHDVTGQEELWR